MSIYGFTVKNAKGDEVGLSDYKNKVLLIVNTATGCGFTPQYSELQELHEKYSEKGFAILDFPCNQFGGQAPGSDEEIVDFCNSRYGVTYIQFAKVEVNGENEIPLYTWLKSQKGGVGSSKIKWNFTKFLIDKKGEVISRYASTKNPKKLKEEIEKLLEE